MNYLDLLKKTSQKYNSLICLGLDPVIDDIPIKGDLNIKDKIILFYEEILNKIVQKNEYPSAVKPNYAFYAQYGIGGIEALVKVMRLYKDAGLPVILDFKRGDIGKTALAYANEAFKFFDADAVTLSPYLGYDSIEPFVVNFPDKGYYILTKTSNKSSGEIQDIDCSGEPLYIKMAKKLTEWYKPGISSVVGATYPEQLSMISDIFINSKNEIPLLIPGIGAQGGDLESVINILNKFDDIKIHRINSSSGINYAYKKYTGMDYADAAVEALKELNEKINNLIK
jgi:orotidine-5'-phosphate decarboxylase